MISTHPLRLRTRLCGSGAVSGPLESFTALMRAGWTAGHSALATGQSWQLPHQEQFNTISLLAGHPEQPYDG